MITHPLKSKAGIRKRHGFTMVELAIVLVGAGLVMGVIWSVAGSVWKAYQYRVMNDQILTVTQNIRTYYDPMGVILDSATATFYPDGTSITADIDNDARRLIPVSMRTTPAVSGSFINHAVSSEHASATDGSFSVYSENSGMRFTILLAGLEREDCVRLLLEFPFLISEVGVTGVVVNGTTHAVNPNNPASPGAGFPMNVTTAEAWCDNTSATGKNGVGIVFRLKN